jgi:multidrug resistance efflux pump
MDETPSVPKNGSTTSGEAEPRREGNVRFGRRHIIWACLAATSVGALFLPMELRITGPFSILPIHNADVRTEIAGIIHDIHVTEGDHVRRGDVLARISVREHIAELRKTEAEMQQARAKLRMQEVGPTTEEIEVARSAVEGARDKLTFARTRLQRDRIQLEKGLISEKEFENTEELATIAENDLLGAGNRLKLVLRGPRIEEVEATRAEIARLEVHHQYLQDQISRTEVRSPVDGIVVTPARELRELAHQDVQKGALIAKVYDLQQLAVEIAVPEKEIADVTVGQHVAFKAQAYPDRTFEGTVQSIATTVAGGGTVSTETPSSLLPSVMGSGGGKAILVKTVIDNTSLILKPGMTGQAKVYCGERMMMEIVLRRIARTLKVEFWSWW